MEDRESAEKVLALLDVETVRPDLIEIAGRREAKNCLPDRMIAHLHSAIASSTTPHLSLRSSQFTPSEHFTKLMRLAKAAYEGSADAGADFAEAWSNAGAVVAPLDHEDRHPDAIVMAAPETAVRRSQKIYYHAHKETADSSVKDGWKHVGTGPRFVEAMPVAMDFDELTELASIATTRYLIDASGAVFFPAYDGGRSMRTAHIHAEALSDSALGLSEHAMRWNSIHHDHIGMSLRHPEGVSPLNDNASRERVLAEFVFHRMVLAGDRVLLRCPEPTIVFAPIHRTRGPALSISDSFVTGMVPGDNPPFLFRLDQVEEVVDFMSEFGRADTSSIQSLKVSDPTRLRFDSDVWNLRAAMKYVLKDLDGRILLFDGATTAAVARLDKSIDSWCRDASLVSSEEAVADMLLDASLFLTAIEAPVMEDIGEPHIREIARICLYRAMGERRIAVAGPTEELAGFSM